MRNIFPVLTILFVMAAVSVSTAPLPSSWFVRLAQSAAHRADNPPVNRLIQEKSPYLLQHAHNPVDWYPWGREAFAEAKREDKPIFLSIGYATCHWCHEMEREVFENPNIAALMNRYFICIKVDREERPDIDKVYMAYTQAFTGSGGWPNSVFLTPDLRPFYAGSYFPAKPRYGLPAFPRVLQTIHDTWIKDREKILRSSQRIASALDREAPSKGTGKKPTEAVLTKAFKDYSEDFDSEYGGFGLESKFPRPSALRFLLRYHHRSGDPKALRMVTFTLEQMAGGGIRDHIGGGFHRYSVDRRWRTPHFEKMLYGQAQLATLYFEAYLLTRDPLFVTVGRETLDYALRDLISPQGAFYAAQDADSPLSAKEGNGEGAYYLWNKDDIATLLGPKNGALFCYRYGIGTDPDHVSPRRHRSYGGNILYIAHSIQETARHAGRPEKEIRRRLREARNKLFQARQRRPRPHLDDQIITSWNGLMISALATGYQATHEARYLKAALRCAAFIADHLYDPRERILHRRYRDGEAALSGQLSDYAFVVQGCLDLYEASLESRWLRLALQLNADQVQLLWDPSSGGFFDSRPDPLGILPQLKTDQDAAEPAGNSVAVMNLLRLYHMSHERQWLSKAETTVDSFAGTLLSHPESLPRMLVSFDFMTGKPMRIVICGKAEAADTERFLNSIHKVFQPYKVVLFNSVKADRSESDRRLPFIENLPQVNAKATVYVCRNQACGLPITEPQQLVSLLNR